MFQQLPMQYIEPLFRPPSEARSLIFQVTNGCSWNRCTYCEMYTDPQKKFRPRAEPEVLAEIRACADQGLEPRRVFLADGDALVLSMRRLRTILGEIRSALPSVSRISSYCLPSNLRHKTDADLQELESLGLKIIYVGAESGDDRVLQLENTIFRSDHVSNHMILKGVLGKDKQRLLNQIDQSIVYFKDHPEFENGNFGY